MRRQNFQNVFNSPVKHVNSIEYLWQFNSGRRARTCFLTVSPISGESRHSNFEDDLWERFEMKVVSHYDNEYLSGSHLRSGVDRKARLLVFSLFRFCLNRCNLHKCLLCIWDLGKSVTSPWFTLQTALFSLIYHNRGSNSDDNAFTYDSHQSLPFSQGIFHNWYVKLPW